MTTPSMGLLSDTGRVLLVPEWLLSQVDGDGALAYLAISYLARDEDYLALSEADRDEERVETTAWLDAAAGHAIVERVAKHWQWPEDRRAGCLSVCQAGRSRAASHHRHQPTPTDNVVVAVCPCSTR